MGSQREKGRGEAEGRCTIAEIGLKVWGGDWQKWMAGKLNTGLLENNLRVRERIPPDPLPFFPTFFRSEENVHQHGRSACGFWYETLVTGFRFGALSSGSRFEGVGDLFCIPTTETCIQNH